MSASIIFGLFNVILQKDQDAQQKNKQSKSKLNDTKIVSCH